VTYTKTYTYEDIDLKSVYRKGNFVIKKTNDQYLIYQKHKVYVVFYGGQKVGEFTDASFTPYQYKANIFSAIFYDSDKKAAGIIVFKKNLTRTRLYLAELYDETLEKFVFDKKILIEKIIKKKKLNGEYS